MLPPSPSDWLEIEPEVAGALTTGAPVVALESTIITHGMPWPQNFETARALESEVRDCGAVPATIAVTGRRIRIGLDGNALESLARADNVAKLSRADLAAALAAGKSGSTTVAATMMAARLAGIDVFATGGIGGVHRGAEVSFDISADLEELDRTNVITVCSGAKAVLDIARTLEVLETKGVCVIGYGTDDFPAFWSRSSGLACPLRFDGAAEIAQLWRVRKAIKQTGGLLVANPVPRAAEIPREEMEPFITEAVSEAYEAGISGKALTPWLLQYLFERTAGRSLETNIALARNNARLAAEIAVALAALDL